MALSRATSSCHTSAMVSSGHWGWANSLHEVLHATLKPIIELCQAGPVPLGRFSQNAPTPVLYVLLHDAFLPTGSSVAELVLKQVVTRHRFKAGVDDALFAMAHFVDGRFHVVVDTALCYTFKDSKAPCMRIK